LRAVSLMPAWSAMRYFIWPGSIAMRAGSIKR
jgi:hypothetical protein